MLISVNKRHFEANIDLIGSKSESNRALMINHYSNSKINIENISVSDDTDLLIRLLHQIKTADKNKINTIDCRNAGTVLRFLMTALSMTEGQWLLTGDERMLQRPIAPLVEALLSLGASIDYRGETGFPPVLIKGATIIGGRAIINTDKSSQYASSLMLAAPLWHEGLQLHLVGNLTSLPYIDMTADMMRKCGAKVKRLDREVIIEHADYKNVKIDIEADWSAASYWYEIIAFSNSSEIFLRNLKKKTSQGDMMVYKIFEELGVYSISDENGMLLKQKDVKIKHLFFDFLNTPDLFPSVVATCAGLQVSATFTGLQNMKIKESDRMTAIMTELSKIGVIFEKLSDDVLYMKSLHDLPEYTHDNPIVFNNYNDHRIAMALAPLCMKIGAVSMENIEVVIKSYPAYWNDLVKDGIFSLNEE